MVKQKMKENRIRSRLFLDVDQDKKYSRCFLVDEKEDPEGYHEILETGQRSIVRVFYLAKNSKYELMYGQTDCGSRSSYFTCHMAYQTDIIDLRLNRLPVNIYTQLRNDNKRCPLIVDRYEKKHDNKFIGIEDYYNNRKKKIVTLAWTDFDDKQSYNKFIKPKWMTQEVTNDSRCHLGTIYDKHHF